MGGGGHCWGSVKDSRKDGGRDQRGGKDRGEVMRRQKVRAAGMKN